MSLPLTLEDLSPKEVVFTLSSRPGKSFTLCKWTLRVRAWAVATYGQARLQEIFKNQNIIEIGRMAFFMLKEKDAFKTEDEFFDAVETPTDHLTLITALLGTIGIAEPQIEEVAKAISLEEKNRPKAKRPKRKKA